ncbi:MAG: response regulator [Bradyrhizobium sp.]|nr:MAG: response regulator [Bradyrhizobium sp.]
MARLSLVPRRQSLRSLAPLAVGFLLLLLAAGANALVSIERQQADFWIRHTLEVTSRLDRIDLLATDAETGQRGYLLTGQFSYLEPYEAARAQIGPEIDGLAAATADNPVQVASIVDLRAAMAARLTELQKTVDLRSSGGAEGALAIVNAGTGKALMASVRQALEVMLAEENGLLERRQARAKWLEGVGQAGFVGAILLVIVFGALAIADARRRLLELEAANSGLRHEMAERQAAEDRVRQLLRLEAVGQLTGGVAHDFNNMLAIILGALGVAKRRLTGSEHPDIAKFIDAAVDGARRAAALTARLLAFSRQQPLEPRALDANRLVAGMSELLQRTLGETIQIETVLAAGAWRVWADPAQLENAMINLAVNARDAMPDGGKLTIETGNADLDERYAAAHSEVTPGQYVQISVTDTGAGMAREVMERAFDPFYTTKGVGRGTGLGLSQVFGFVKQSRGHVKLYSEPGRGTTVKIYLPRHFGDAPPALDEGKATPTPKGSAETIVLVVEDEAAVRHMSVAALRELGYGVIETETPGEALKALEVRPEIALLFTDIVMPDMNGRELAARAIALRPGLKVLYTTGYTRNAVVHNGVVDPGVAFLAKPFTLEQLALKMRQTLGE